MRFFSSFEAENHTKRSASAGRFLNCEIERRPSLYRSFSPDLSAMAMDDPLNGGETDSRSLKFAQAMKALKGSEQLVDISHIEPRPVISDEIDLPFSLFDDAEFDGRSRVF